MENAKINPSDIELIKKVANVSLNKTTITLQQILGKNMNITFPSIEIMEKEEIESYFGGDFLRVGLHFYIYKDINAMLIYIFNKKDANLIIDILDNKPAGTTTILNEVEVSTIKEISNILSGSYLNSLAELSSLTLLQSLPHLVLDSGNSILDFINNFKAGHELELFLLKSNMTIKESDFIIRGDLMLIMPHDELQKLLNGLRKNAK